MTKRQINNLEAILTLAARDACVIQLFEDGKLMKASMHAGSIFWVTLRLDKATIKVHEGLPSGLRGKLLGKIQTSNGKVVRFNGEYLKGLVDEANKRGMNMPAHML